MLMFTIVCCSPICARCRRPLKSLTPHTVIKCVVPFRLSRCAPVRRCPWSPRGPWRCAASSPRPLSPPTSAASATSAPAPPSSRPEPRSVMSQRGRALHRAAAHDLTCRSWSAGRTGQALICGLRNWTGFQARAMRGWDPKRLCSHEPAKGCTR